MKMAYSSNENIRGFGSIIFWLAFIQDSWACETGGLKEHKIL